MFLLLFSAHNFLFHDYFWKQCYQIEVGVFKVDLHRESTMLAGYVRGGPTWEVPAIQQEEIQRKEIRLTEGCWREKQYTENIWAPGYLFYKGEGWVESFRKTLKRGLLSHCGSLGKCQGSTSCHMETFVRLYSPVGEGYTSLPVLPVSLGQEHTALVPHM